MESKSRQGRCAEDKSCYISHVWLIYPTVGIINFTFLVFFFHFSFFFGKHFPKIEGMLNTENAPPLSQELVNTLSLRGFMHGQINKC